MKHTLMMLGGCVLPFLLIFILPALGVSTGVTMAVFIVAMVGCHLFMGHGGHEGHATEGAK